MDWSSPFVVYRISPEGRLEEVFHAQDIKKARYWLTYIAQPGDVLCKTPVHPKHSGQGKSPEYWGHKEKSGKMVTDEGQWKGSVEEKNLKIDFPTEPQGIAS